MPPNIQIKRTNNPQNSFSQQQQQHKKNSQNPESFLTKSVRSCEK